MTVDGLKTHLSRYEPSETVARVLSVVERLAMTVLARVDHAAAAATVGMALRPTEVILFGNPKTGTPLMQDAQTIGVDLPSRCSSGRMSRTGPGSPTTIRSGLLHGTRSPKDRLRFSR